MLNVHLSYKPPGSWRILFWSGGYPRKFSLVKKFRAFVVLDGGCRKEITLHEMQLNRRFSCGRPVMPDKKRVYNGNVYPCTQTEEYYVHTDSKTVYI